MEIRRTGGTAAKRLNVLAYGPPGTGKTFFGLGFPNPALVDFEDGYLTAETGGFGHVPLLQPKSREDYLRIIEAPEVVASEVAEACDGYKVETWIFDSATSLSTMLMGKSQRGDKPGYGIMGEMRSRVDADCPSIEDYKMLNLYMTEFFNTVRQMPYHTYITAHSCLDKTEDSPRGLGVPESLVKYAGYPVLTGKLQYNAGNLADVYIYMETHIKAGEQVFTAHLRKYGTYNARHRLGAGTPARIDHPTFEKLWTIYNERRENVEN